MSNWPETQQSLILRVKNSEDAAAWSAFMTIYRPVVFRMARSRGLQDADADDLTQQVFASISHAVERWEPNERRATLSSVAVSDCSQRNPANDHASQAGHRNRIRCRG